MLRSHNLRLAAWSARRGYPNINTNSSGKGKNMFQSSLTPKATALLVPAVASLCLLASISLVTAQEGREKSGQRGQGGERGEAGRQPSQRPAGDQGAGTRSEAGRQPSQAAEVNRGE